jgi:hypothetical protein
MRWMERTTTVATNTSSYNNDAYEDYSARYQ